jgi:predicted O-methyltransferase YrrM
VASAVQLIDDASSEDPSAKTNMKLELLQSRLEGIPHTTPARGAVLYNSVLQNRYFKCLELGFAHGVGTAYIAGALDEIGAGRITAVDRKAALKRIPRADELLTSLSLRHRAELIYGESSYTWFLLDRIEQKDMTFDFCFLDGSHTWETDGFALLLVERVLESGGMIFLDDLNWTIASSPTLANRPEFLKLPERERTTPQVRKVFELLVKGNTAFSTIYEKDGCGFAIKR